MLYDILSWLLFGSRSHEHKAYGSSRVLGAVYCSGLFRITNARVEAIPCTVLDMSLTMLLALNKIDVEGGI